VDRIARLTAEHGAGSPIGLVGKAIGVRVYGKLAERPDRDGLAFAAEAPGDDALPYLDATGEEVDDAWCTPRSVVRSHQHIDIAAEITAAVRGRLYRTVADLGSHGIRVLAADTDGLLVSDDPSNWLCPQNPAIGDWRYCGHDPDAIINGPRFASIGGRVLTAGTSPQDGRVVALAHERGAVTVEGKVMAPAWATGAGSRRVTRTLHRAAPAQY